jgi:hypothetical protein
VDYWAQPDLRNSFYDGIFAHMFATLTGGVFLTGFALHLGMSEMLIGFLAAMPFLGALCQLPAAHHLTRGGGKKRLCLRAARGARLAWLLPHGRLKEVLSKAVAADRGDAHAGHDQL